MFEEANVIVYDALWCRILEDSHPNMKIGYYLIDEVRREAYNDKINKTRYSNDEYACIHSDFIMTMTGLLAQSRKQYNDHVFVIGNGATIPVNDEAQKIHLSRSVGFVGNFRDWIDTDLLESLIRNRKDLLFVFAGNVEDKVKPCLEGLLSNYANTFYAGRFKKEDAHRAYHLTDVIIVPYKQNEFIKHTRPIKIVEAVMAGKPVVTVPVDGYCESHFIKYANDVESFGRAIDYFLEHPVKKDTIEYQQFIKDNSWSSKAKLILEAFASCSP